MGKIEAGDPTVSLGHYVAVLGVLGLADDLAQLWRRIVFYIVVSNTDCHLRNHGFVLEGGGWALSPAFDVNAVSPAAGLHLSITEDDNSLDYALAMDVIEYFQLGKAEAEKNTAK